MTDQGIKWHPMDDKGFVDWLRNDCDMEPDFAYGIYDSQWLALYSDYLEETAK